MKSRKVLSVHLVFFVLMGGEVGPFTELIRCTACLKMRELVTKLITTSKSYAE